MLNARVFRVHAFVIIILLVLYTTVLHGGSLICHSHSLNCWGHFTINWCLWHAKTPPSRDIAALFLSFYLVFRRSSLSQGLLLALLLCFPVTSFACYPCFRPLFIWLIFSWYFKVSTFLKKMYIFVLNVLYCTSPILPFIFLCLSKLCFIFALQITCCFSDSFCIYFLQFMLFFFVNQLFDFYLIKMLLKIDKQKVLQN